MIPATVFPEGGPPGYTLGAELVDTALLHRHWHICAFIWSVLVLCLETERRTVGQPVPLGGSPCGKCQGKLVSPGRKVVTPSFQGIRAV